MQPVQSKPVANRMVSQGSPACHECFDPDQDLGVLRHASDADFCNKHANPGNLAEQ